MPHNGPVILCSAAELDVECNAIEKPRGTNQSNVSGSVETSNNVFLFCFNELGEPRRSMFLNNSPGALRRGWGSHSLIIRRFFAHLPRRLQLLVLLLLLLLPPLLLLQSMLS